MLRMIAGIGVFQVLVVLVNLIRSKIIAVLLGPEGVGVVGLVDQLVQLVLYVSTLSLPFAAIRFLSRAHSEGADAFRRSYGSFLKALLQLTTLGAVLGAAAVMLQPRLLGGELSGYWLYLVPAFIGIPAMACHGLFSNALAATQRVRATMVMLVLVGIALTVSGVLGISVGGILGLYVGNLVANTLVAIGAAIYLRQKLGLPLLDRRASIRQELRRTPDLVSFALIFYVTNLASSLALFVGRYAVLASYGEAEAGLLQAALGIFAMLRLVLGPANGLYLQPILNRRMPTSEKLSAAAEFQRKLLLLVLLLAMPMVLFPQWLVALLFSPAFLPVSMVIGVFVVTQVIQLMAEVYQALLIGFDDLKAFATTAVVGRLLLAATAWVLTPVVGIPGVALAFLIGSITELAVAYWRLRVAHGMQARPGWWLGLGYGIVALTIASGVASLLDPWQPVAVAARFIILAAFACSLLLFLAPPERAEILAMARTIITRTRSGTRAA